MPYRDPQARLRYQREWARRKRSANKAKAIALLGGACVRCGYKEHEAALEIDHIKLARRWKATSRDGNQASLLVRGKIAIEDVQLLCANCHAIKTFEEDRKHFLNYKRDVG